MADWQKFFVLAGIPNGVATRYATSFKENRITKDMLPDLDKGTLSELGVTAIGDQLSILRRVKACGGSLTAGSSTASSSQPNIKVRITGPAAGGREQDESHALASSHRKGRPPPDRHEIYHVKMPDGNTTRTKHIMKKAEHLRRNGLAVRGTTGVRKAGRSVSPIDKHSVAVRGMRREVPEVSSSTDSVIDRLGVRGLRSDAYGSSARLQSGRVTKKSVNISSRGAEVAMSRMISSSLGQQNPRGTVQLSARVNKQSLNTVTRTSGSTLPRVSINLGGPLRKGPTVQRQPVQQRIRLVGQNRMGRVARSAPQRRGQLYEAEMVEEDEEYMDDGEMYDDDAEGLEDYEDEQYVEYVEAPSSRRHNVFNRLSK